MLKYSVIPLLALCSAVAQADHRHYSHSTTRLAWVTQVSPIYERISYSVPREQCWQESVSYEHRSNTALGITGRPFITIALTEHNNLTVVGKPKCKAKPSCAATYNQYITSMFN